MHMRDVNVSNLGLHCEEKIATGENETEKAVPRALPLQEHRYPRAAARPPPGDGSERRADQAAAVLETDRPGEEKCKLASCIAARPC